MMRRIRHGSSQHDDPVPSHSGLHTSCPPIIDVTKIFEKKKLTSMKIAPREEYFIWTTRLLNTTAIAETLHDPTRARAAMCYVRRRPHKALVIIAAV